MRRGCWAEAGEFTPQNIHAGNRNKKAAVLFISTLLLSPLSYKKKKVKRTDLQGDDQNGNIYFIAGINSSRSSTDGRLFLSGNAPGLFRRPRRRASAASAERNPIHRRALGPAPDPSPKEPGFQDGPGELSATRPLSLFYYSIFCN